MNHSARLLGVFWMVLSMISFSATMSVAKFLETEVPTIVKVFIRLFFGLTLLLPFMRTHIRTFKINQPSLYFFRATLVCGSMVCTYYTYSHLPLALATAIGFTTPLITTTLSILFLKEKISGTRWFVMIAGYVGVLVMLRVSFLTIDPAIFVGLLGNLLASCAILIANKMMKTEPAEQILFFTTLLCFMFLTGPAVHAWQDPNTTQWILLCLLGGTGVFSQYCYLRAIQHEKPSYLAPFEYLRLLFSVPVGFLIFNETPHFYTVLGAVFIMASNLFLVYREAR